MSGYTLIPSQIEIKVFNNIIEIRDFLIKHGATDHIPSKKRPTIGGTTYSQLIRISGWIVVYINTESWVSGLEMQKCIAHETVHVVRKIQNHLGMRGEMPEEIDAYMVGQTYLEIAKQLIDLEVDLSRKVENPSEEFNKMLEANR